MKPFWAMAPMRPRRTNPHQRRQLPQSTPLQLLHQSTSLRQKLRLRTRNIPFRQPNPLRRRQHDQHNTTLRSSLSSCHTPEKAYTSHPASGTKPNLSRQQFITECLLVDFKLHQLIIKIVNGPFPEYDRLLWKDLPLLVFHLSEANHHQTCEMFLPH